jgi:hypothetical protein
VAHDGAYLANKRDDAGDKTNDYDHVGSEQVAIP